MNCPRCRTAITSSFDPEGIVVCPSCGARLMTRSAALRSKGMAKARPSEPPDASPGSTLPPTPREALAGGQGSHNDGRVAALEAVLGELRAVRTMQEEMLQLLRGGAGPANPAGGLDPDGPPSVSLVRSRYRKSVILIDDDDETREAASAELEQADVPVRAFSSGNAAIQAIAEEKPDVIAIELAVSGDMGGKDIINLIKATMEWVDIPIVLWTREAVANQKEARQIHGADEVVPKSTGAAALAARVITLFRRG